MARFKFKFSYIQKNFQFVVVAFVISLATLIGISFLIRKQVHIYGQYSDAIEHSFEVMNRVEVLEQLLKDAETGVRGYLLTNDSVFLDPYRNVNDSIKRSMDDLKHIISNSEKYGGNSSVQLDRIRYINEKIILQTSILNDLLVNHTKLDKALLRKGKDILDSLRVNFDSMRQYELGLLAKSRIEKNRLKEATPAYLSSLLAFSIILTLASFAYILKELFTRYKYQTELERKIAELNQSNEELEQIAYASSHHLQEPLRKLRLFSSKLLHKYKNDVDSDVKKSVERIDASALAMQELIQNFADYTSLEKQQESFTNVSLNTVLYQALYQVQNEFSANEAELKTDRLPEVKGSFQRLVLLFRNLLENSIKYAKPGRIPEITVTYRTGPYVKNEKNNNQEYHIVSIHDNGIGFDNQYVEKIFALFRRLHTQQSFFEGKGIGLAICKRIMSNHNGYITASGKVNEGALFELYFPIN
ncbi:sensor histidine kinase [Pinibacter soli]|uniref:histidine kinase n=1 Tax=Pinibacter soli TaxID=3044211 RepID=A0ABT6RJ86_9BACT|nr:sensor histidine kinase [Pinibacter soli]MDI3322632.1 CHASE3 domain-containing protein [Pinibacter soli]